MPRRSAGILPYKWVGGDLQVLLVHPGGPFWRKRDMGSWSVAKGEQEGGEKPELAARREFAEETGWTVDGPLIELDEIRQTGGKYLKIYAVEAEFEPKAFISNTFQIEWPPRSGRFASFPEVDRVAWFGIGEASQRILASQRGLLEQIQELVGRR
jgi:predicted NUDIX family NTP pyrophosphohydrolase